MVRIFCYVYFLVKISKEIVKKKMVKRKWVWFGMGVKRKYIFVLNYIINNVILINNIYYMCIWIYVFIDIYVYLLVCLFF